MDSIRVKVEMRELYINNSPDDDRPAKTAAIAAPGAISIKNTWTKPLRRIRTPSILTFG